MSKPDIQKIEFPVFGVTWYTCFDNTSIVAYCGGGGSARSGIGNSIVIHHYTPDSEPYMRLTIDTENQICVNIFIGSTYLGHNPDPSYPPEIVVLAAVGNEIRIYSAFSGRLLSKTHTLGAEKDGVNCVTMSSDGNMILCGCEGGKILSYMLKGLPQPPVSKKKEEKGENNEKESEEKVYAVTELVKVAEMNGHKKAVCSVAFRPDETARAISSAKDGTCREWDVRTGKILAMMQCTIPAQVPPPKRNVPHQILVRSCSYSPCGGFVFTVASGRRGNAYLGKWHRVPAQQMNQNPEKKLPPFVPWDNYCVSNCPISAMSMNVEGTILSMGNVEGEILFIGAESGNLIKKFLIHDLPVTCIAARPSSVKNTFLKNTNDLVIDAISVSADNKMAFITSQSPGMTLITFFRRLIRFICLCVVAVYCFQECKSEFKSGDFTSIKQCLIGQPPTFVLQAPLH